MGPVPRRKTSMLKRAYCFFTIVAPAGCRLSSLTKGAIVFLEFIIGAIGRVPSDGMVSQIESDKQYCFRRRLP
jgi:hypothetical protein